MLAVVLAILGKLVVISKLGFRSLSKRITSLIFLNIYTPPQHTIIDKANSKFGLKIKEDLHVNGRKPNSNAQQNHLALIFSQLLSPLLLSTFVCFSFVGFCIFLSSIVFIICTLIIGTF